MRHGAAPEAARRQRQRAVARALRADRLRRPRRSPSSPPRRWRSARPGARRPGRGSLARPDAREPAAGDGAPRHGALPVRVVRRDDARLHARHRRQRGRVRRSARGAAPVNLTASCAKFDSFPAISPDGRQVAYTSECGGGGLFVVPIDGGTPRRIAPLGFHPAWSPDGRQIAFSTRPDRGFSMVAPLGERDPRARPGRREERTIVRDGGVRPGWSPDGRLLAYRVPRGEAPGLRLVRVDDGSTAVRIVPTIPRRATSAGPPTARASSSRDGARASAASGSCRSIPPRAARPALPTSSPPRRTSCCSRRAPPAMGASWPLARGASPPRSSGCRSTRRRFQPVGPPSRLSGTSRVESMPDLSPDGGQIVYVSQDGRSGPLDDERAGHGCSASSRATRSRSTTRAGPRTARASPSSAIAPATYEVYVIDPSGGEPRRVTRVTAAAPGRPPGRPTGDRSPSSRRTSASSSSTPTRSTLRAKCCATPRGVP